MSEDETWLVPGEPYPEEIDGHLHAVNTAANEGMSIVGKFLGSRGNHHVAAFRELSAKYEEWRGLVSGGEE